MAAIEEVVVSPTPDLMLLLPHVKPEMRDLIMSAISKDPSHRPSAAALGQSLDRWLAAQGTPGSPERLQAHLAMIFPESYQPAIRRTTEVRPM